MASTPEEGHRAKRLKLSQPKVGAREGAGRFRLSVDGLVEEPLGTRGPAKGKGYNGRGPAAAARNARASTGNLDLSVDKKAAAMVADVFSPKTVTSPVQINGVATPPPSTDTSRESGFSLPKRHVSGPGQFTPRALLKAEDEFEKIGVDAAGLLERRGDSVSWWIAEQVLWLHQFLENPQKGRPKTIDARPKTRPKDRHGREADHCCPQGGVTHLLPCNMSRPPSAKESFGWASKLREELIPEHHASKGGINTIAFVGELMLDKLTGESKVDEEEFKLLAGSENIRNYYGRGHKRYKAPDPNVDPTKQPILALKSLKKMAQNEDLVFKLKSIYSWALSEKQENIGASPIEETPFRPAPVQLLPAPVRLAAPAIASAPSPTHLPALNKRIRLSSDTTSQPKKLAMKLTEEVRKSPSNDARLSRQPGFPLHEIARHEAETLRDRIEVICDLVRRILNPPPIASNQTAVPAKLGAKAKSRKRPRRTSHDTDHAVDLLLTLANGGPLANNIGDDEPIDDTASSESSAPDIVIEFVLTPSSRLDPYLKTLIEVVMANAIQDRQDKAHETQESKEHLAQQLEQLKRLLDGIELKANIWSHKSCTSAISKLYGTLLRASSNA